LMECINNKFRYLSRGPLSGVGLPAGFFKKDGK